MGLINAVTVEVESSGKADSGTCPVSTYQASGIGLLEGLLERRIGLRMSAYASFGIGVLFATMLSIIANSSMVRIGLEM